MEIKKEVVKGALITTLLTSSVQVEAKEPEPLNVRLNNPMNIKAVKSNNWQGSIGNNGVFEKFISPEMGTRAGLIVVSANIENTGTIKDFVRRFGTEPNESYADKHIRNYVTHLERGLGKKTVTQDDLFSISKLVVHYEGGYKALEFYSPFLDEYENYCLLFKGEQCIKVIRNKKEFEKVAEKLKKDLKK